MDQVVAGNDVGFGSSDRLVPIEKSSCPTVVVAQRPVQTEARSVVNQIEPGALVLIAGPFQDSTPALGQLEQRSDHGDAQVWPHSGDELLEDDDAAVSQRHDVFICRSGDTNPPSDFNQVGGTSHVSGVVAAKLRPSPSQHTRRTVWPNNLPRSNGASR